jgi:hypothetical protein
MRNGQTRTVGNGPRTEWDADVTSKPRTTTATTSPHPRAQSTSQRRSLCYPRSNWKLIDSWTGCSLPPCSLLSPSTCSVHRPMLIVALTSPSGRDLAGFLRCSSPRMERSYSDTIHLPFPPLPIPVLGPSLMAVCCPLRSLQRRFGR